MVGTMKPTKKQRAQMGARYVNRPPRIGEGGSKVSSGKGIAKRRVSREAPIQQGAVKYLRQRKRYVGDIQFCHVPNEVRKGGGRDQSVRNEIARKKAEGLTPGAPDLVIWLDVAKARRAGVPPVLSVEVKFGSTAQSESQKEFGAGLHRLGHGYTLLRTTEPAEAGRMIHVMLEAIQPMKTVPFGMLAWVAEDDPRIPRGPSGNVAVGLQATQD